MPLVRGEVASAWINGRLVLAGGLRGFTTTSKAVSIYNAAQDTWSEGPALPAARHHAAAAAFDGRVYVSGGARVGHATGRRAPTSGCCVPEGAGGELPSMPEGRQGHAMVAHRRQPVRRRRRRRHEPHSDLRHRDQGLVVRRSAPRRTRPPPRRRVGREGLGDRRTVGGLAQPRSTSTTRSATTWAPRPAAPRADERDGRRCGRRRAARRRRRGPGPLRRRRSRSHYVTRGRSDRNGRSGRASLLAVHGAGYGVDGRRLIVAGGASRQGALSTISWTDVTQLSTTDR